MAHHHDNHHPEEKKPVSFTVPFILATVTLIAILSLVSLGDPCHGGHGECACTENCSKECMEACEKGDHSHHDAEGHEKKAASSAHHEEHAATPATADSTAAATTTAHTADSAAHHNEHAH